jgi:hypothetical protein
MSLKSQNALVFATCNAPETFGVIFVHLHQ